MDRDRCLDFVPETSNAKFHVSMPIRNIEHCGKHALLEMHFQNNYCLLR